MLTNKAFKNIIAESIKQSTLNREDWEYVKTSDGICLHLDTDMYEINIQAYFLSKEDPFIDNGFFKINYSEENYDIGFGCIQLQTTAKYLEWEDAPLLEAIVHLFRYLHYPTFAKGYLSEPEKEMHHANKPTGDNLDWLDNLLAQKETN